MIITQTQIEALASFFSSISITSFVAIQMPIEREGKPDFLCECEERERTCSVTLQSIHKLPSIEVLVCCVKSPFTLIVIPDLISLPRT